MKTAMDYVEERVGKLLDELSTIEARRKELQKVVTTTQEETQNRVREARLLQNRNHEIHMMLRFIPA